MSEREQLREALAKALAGSHGPGTIIDAVLNILDQQGWVDPTSWGIALLNTHAWEYKCAEIEAERDAALQEMERLATDNDLWKDAFNSRAEAARINHETIRGLMSDNDALREAARYEQVGWLSIPGGLHSDEAHAVMTQQQALRHEMDGCVPLYRRVTEGRMMRPDLSMANPDCEFCHGTGREATVPPGGTFPCSAGCEEAGAFGRVTEGQEG